MRGTVKPTNPKTAGRRRRDRARHLRGGSTATEMKLLRGIGGKEAERLRILRDRNSDKTRPIRVLASLLSPRPFGSEWGRRGRPFLSGFRSPPPPLLILFYFPRLLAFSPPSGEKLEANKQQYTAVSVHISTIPPRQSSELTSGPWN